MYYLYLMFRYTYYLLFTVHTYVYTLFLSVYTSAMDWIYLSIYLSTPIDNI